MPSAATTREPAPRPHPKECLERPCAGNGKIEGERRASKGNDVATRQMSAVIQHLRRTVLRQEKGRLQAGLARTQSEATSPRQALHSLGIVIG